MDCAKWNFCRVGWHVRHPVWEYGVMHTWERSNPTFSATIKGPELVVMAEWGWQELVEDNRELCENTSSVLSNRDKIKWQINNSYARNSESQIHRVFPSYKPVLRLLFHAVFSISSLQKVPWWGWQCGTAATSGIFMYTRSLQINTGHRRHRKVSGGS